jgi:hypothetical protein
MLTLYAVLAALRDAIDVKNTLRDGQIRGEAEGT